MALLVFAAAAAAARARAAGGRRSSCRVHGGDTVMVWALWGDTIVASLCGSSSGHQKLSNKILALVSLRIALA